MGKSRDSSLELPLKHLTFDKASWRTRVWASGILMPWWFSLATAKCPIGNTRDLQILFSYSVDLVCFLFHRTTVLYCLLSTVLHAIVDFFVLFFLGGRKNWFPAIPSWPEAKVLLLIFETAITGLF